MNERAENQKLLNKQYLPENQTYRGDGGSSSGDDSCHSGGWWGGSASETGSSCSSCCSDSQSDDGSVAEWEAEVDALGNLFFIRSPPESELQKFTLPVLEESTDLPSSVPEGQPTRRGKLAGLIRHRNSKRYRLKGSTSGPSNESTCNVNQSERLQTSTSNISSNFSSVNCQENDYAYEVTLHLDPAARHNLGRRASLAESLLGLVVSAAGNENKVRIVGFIPNGEAIRLNGIRIGDWLRYISNQEVTIQTLDQVLATFSAPCKVQLKLQRMANDSINQAKPTGFKQTAANSVVLEQSERVHRLVTVESLDELCCTVQASCAGALYLSQEGLSAGEETQGDDKSLLYCFPAPVKKCPVAAARGALLTLHLLLPQLTPSSPRSSTLMLRGELVHVLYWACGHELLLLAFPGSCRLQDCYQLIADVVRYLQFTFQSLSRAFTAPELRSELDNFFALFFSRLIHGHCVGPQFEELMPVAHWIPLPVNAQIRLNSALSELESNDFEELGSNIDDCQRLFSVIGSCFYHKGYLLASHLPRVDLPDVHSLLRQRGLIPLLRSEPLRQLVIWHQVYPSSCSRGLIPDKGTATMHQSTSNAYPTPTGSWFLLTVGQEWDMLAVLLESSGCTVSITNNPGPDVCFVEEALETLSYIQTIGISAIASKWILGPPRPQVTTPELVGANKSSRPQDNFLGFMRQEAKFSPPSVASSSLLSLSSPGGRRASDNMSASTSSLAKHRGSLDKLHSGVSAGSEDSASQACSSSVLSECSDEIPGSSNSLGASGPVVGRRVERELRSGAGSRSSGGSGPQRSRSDVSDSDDSDWETYQAYSRRGYVGNGSEMSDATLSLLADVEAVVPMKLTAGEENALFHYVRLDTCEGVLLAPPTGRESLSGASQLREVLICFRECCHNIHSLLQNAVGFKKMMGQEMTKTMSRSLVAIKEHGVLFELSSPDNENKKGGQPLTFWVVGRLFFAPHPREIYVCYLDTAPQNMVEIAFRLGLSAADLQESITCAHIPVITKKLRCSLGDLWFDPVWIGIFMMLLVHCWILYLPRMLTVS